MDTLREFPASHPNHSEQTPKTQPRLQDLIPIVVVIVGGCESCAENMVRRALLEGSSREDIDKTLRILEGMQKLDCLLKAIGPEIISRMDKPIAAAQRTLREQTGVSNA
jgi:AhpD family alkylhydroperoxidase